MKILWLSWKDEHHPLAGGAEVITDSLLTRLASHGHEVTLLTGGYPGAKEVDTLNGYQIIRVGGRLSVYWRAFQYYKKNLRTIQFGLIIEEINTIPFFSTFYIKSHNVPQTKHFLFFHQLAREVWFYEMIFPLSLVGYSIEPLYLWLLRKMPVITISLSTTHDLMRYGFKKKDIFIISEGVSVPPIESLSASTKYPTTTMLSLGSMRAMKRTIHAVKAFEYAKARLPSLKLILAGNATSPYGKKVAHLVDKSPFARDITILGSVSDEKKRELMEQSHLICVTSIKEGWGLIVTEAGRVGTPAVVYNVDGLRDSVKDGLSGLVSKRNNPQSLALSITELLSKPEYYNGVRKNAYDFAKKITFEQQYEDFEIITGLRPQPQNVDSAH